MLELEPHKNGVVLPVRAHAGARRNAIAGVRDGMLRVAVTEAPEKGKANRAIVALLSRELARPKSSIELIAGESSSRKRFLLVDVDVATIRDAIKQLGFDDVQ